jgi:hypothetical protein
MNRLNLYELHKERVAEYLIRDLEILGLPIDFDLTLKPYSKKYYGNYRPLKSLVTIYLCMESVNKIRPIKPYPYNEILETAIHEVIHHYQHTHEEGFKRVKGVMHNPNFYLKYNECFDKALELKLLKEYQRGGKRKRDTVSTKNVD